MLDEPTNHLDLEAIEQLEDALGDYEGTLILVTHDRRMLERVAVNRRIVVEDGIVREPRRVTRSLARRSTAAPRRAGGRSRSQMGRAPSSRWAGRERPR